MAKLEVQIGADSSELKSEIAKAEVLIERLKKEKAVNVKLGLDVAPLQKNINEAKAQLATLKKSVDTTGNSFGSMSPKVANGGNALMQFSRIAQDAPYGIIGIGNNITSTVEAFGHLKQSTGSTGNALKALAGSIAGSGGILLAVSLVTTALTYMAQSGLTVGDLMDKVTGKFDAQRKALTELGAEAAKTAGSEIASMKALVSASQDETLSREKRLLAVKQLQDQFPAYFGNLTKEKILNGDVSIAVDNVSKALIARARASAIAGKMGELAGERLKLEEKREQAILDIKKEQKDVNEDKSIYNAGAVFALKAAVDSYKDIVKEIKVLDSQSKKYSERENVATKDSILLLKEKAKVISTTMPKTPTAIGSTPQVSSVGGGFGTDALAETSGKVLQIARTVQGAEGMIATSMGNIKVAFDTSGAYMLEALNQFNESASGIIEVGIADTFGRLGAAIGGALANGGNVMKAAGNALLAGLGALLTNLGMMAIQVGVGLLGIKAALKTLNPAVAIGAGVALIALGAVFSAKASSLGGSKGTSGGSVQGGNSYSSPSSSTGGGGGSSFQGGTVVFEISGQSLIGVLGNTLDKNRRLGGSLAL